MTKYQHNDIIALMIPNFDIRGNLPPGLHESGWNEFADRFGHTAQRQRLKVGLYEGILLLSLDGCSVLYVDGSFVTSKAFPQDFDAVWETNGVDLHPLKTSEPAFFRFENKRAAQKARFGGEFFPSGIEAGPTGRTFLEFFQSDRMGNPKGLMILEIKDMKR